MAPRGMCQCVCLAWELRGCGGVGASVARLHGVPQEGDEMLAMLEAVLFLPV